MIRQFKDEEGFIITVTYQNNGSCICETNDDAYNAINTDGYWIADPQDMEDGVRLGILTEVTGKVYNG